MSICQRLIMHSHTSNNIILWLSWKRFSASSFPIIEINAVDQERNGMRFFFFTLFPNNRCISLFIRTLMSCPSPVPMKKTIQAFCLTASTEVMWFCLKSTFFGFRIFGCRTQTHRSSDLIPTSISDSWRDELSDIWMIVGADYTDRPQH